MIFFISGHRNISESEFTEHYAVNLDYAIANNSDFVVGDYYGVDYMAQKYLKGKVDDSKVTVYHMMDAPRNFVKGFNTKGGYLMDEDRDAAMTNESHADIAWSRTKESGTARNLRRRAENDRLKWLEYMQSNMAAELKYSIKTMYDSHISDITKARETISNN